MAAAGMACSSRRLLLHESSLRVRVQPHRKSPSTCGVGVRVHGVKWAGCVTTSRQRTHTHLLPSRHVRAGQPQHLAPFLTGEAARQSNCLLHTRMQPQKQNEQATKMEQAARMRAPTCAAGASMRFYVARARMGRDSSTHAAHVSLNTPCLHQMRTSHSWCAMHATPTPSRQAAERRPATTGPRSLHAAPQRWGGQWPGRHPAWGVALRNSWRAGRLAKLQQDKARMPSKGGNTTAVR